MLNLNTKYVLHLDSLREESKVKINDFCDDVCSRRSYSRYLNGERIMSPEIMEKFCQKLGLTLKDFLHSYNVYDNDEYNKVNQVYQYVIKNQHNEARKLMIELEEKTFTNHLAQSLYEYTVIYYNLKTNSITKAHAYDSLKTLIDYPNCMSKSKFTLQDILALRTIAILEFEINDMTGLNFLKELLGSGPGKYQLISSDSRDILPPIYQVVSKRLGTIGDIEGLLSVVKNGIDFCLRKQTFHGLENLLYYALLGHHKLGNNEKRDYYAYRDISLCHALYDDTYIKWRTDMISRDISPEYVEEIYKKIYKR